MIITRSPLRITLGGGGTDLPSYYEKFGGFLISAAINRYVYITIHENFTDNLTVKYSKVEHVNEASELQHPILRESFNLMGMNGKGLELSSMADIPAGTGLGSSSSFTTALLKALHVYRKIPILPSTLAEKACDIELNRLKEPIGKQDQYISAYGGITCFNFLKDGMVDAYPLNISRDILDDLIDNLLLFFTGYSRSASSILKEQDQKSKVDDKEMIDNLHFVKDIGLQSKVCLENGNMVEFSRLMDIHWNHKKKRSGNMSNSKIDEWYELAKTHGALGGKLIGAGGGGFLMFYANDKLKLRKFMESVGLKEVRFTFDFEGTRQIIL
jgi:D-glycero-alpha-D-manno-heptose-7-phosphate kinase